VKAIIDNWHGLGRPFVIYEESTIYKTRNQVILPWPGVRPNQLLLQ